MSLHQELTTTRNLRYKIIYEDRKILDRYLMKAKEEEYNFGLGENRRLPTKLATETRQASVTEEKYISSGIRGQSLMMSTL